MTCSLCGAWKSLEELTGPCVHQATSLKRSKKHQSICHACLGLPEYCTLQPTSQPGLSKIQSHPFWNAHQISLASGQLVKAAMLGRAEGRWHLSPEGFSAGPGRFPQQAVLPNDSVSHGFCSYSPSSSPGSYTHHRPAHMQWPGQRGHRGEAVGVWPSHIAYEPGRTAWTDTPALGGKPAGNERRIFVFPF